ncbi:hypothetical protein I3760_08G053500 [Carya illinoinensis]|nr:hypothetical protein I3760_08G053500 [Carya illinoinensis]
MKNYSKVQWRETIPFLGETKPGVSMNTHKECLTEEDFAFNLPPPPYRSETAARVLAHDIQIPLPPCTFQPPSRSSSRKVLRKQDHDPFLAAYRECTKSSNGGNSKLPKNGVKSGLRKNMLIGLSCKWSCSARDGNLVRISQLPFDRSDEEK